MSLSKIRRNEFLEFAFKRQNVRQKYLNELDVRDEKILIAVAVTNANGERLSVIDLLKRSEIGGPTYIQLRLKFLLSRNLIEYQKVEHSRRYQVVPSENFWRYLDELGLTILELMGII